MPTHSPDVTRRAAAIASTVADQVPVGLNDEQMAAVASAIADGLGAFVEQHAATVAAMMKVVGSPATCRSCGAAMYWVKTRMGKNAPYDPDGTSHFVTCPHASQHRRQR